MNHSFLKSGLAGIVGVIIFALLYQTAWSADIERRDVTFKSQGLNCAGWYYVPKDLKPAEKRPAIVMAHGYSGVKEMSLDKYAEKFASAGFIVLVFDYRYLGGSDGEPRGQIIYYEQHQDYRNAISWLTLQKEVDAQRIGIWGTSYSGGHVIHLAAFDKRIKAVVAQVPGVGAWDAHYSKLKPNELARSLNYHSKSRNEAYANGSAKYLPVVTADIKQIAVMRNKTAYDFFTDYAKSKAPNWKNQVTVESLELNLEYNPVINIQLISPTPLLMIVASDDVLTSTELQKKVFERAKEPKKLVIYKGGHFDAYSGSGFEEASKAGLDWFNQHLKP